MKLIEIKKNEVTDFTGDGSFSILFINDKVYLIGYSCLSMDSSANTKNYEHDCDKCIFLGSWDDADQSVITTYDLYFCPQHNLPTVVARYGNDGPDYHCGSVSHQGIKAIEVGKQIARDFNLI